MICLKMWLLGTFRAKLDDAALTGFESNMVASHIDSRAGRNRFEYFLDIDDLFDLAKKRLTRAWRLEERRRYLHEGER